MPINKLVSDYYDWLKLQTKIIEHGDYHEITTPYLDFFNDSIQVYARIDETSVFLTDDGYTLTNLETAGVQLNSSRMKTIKEICLNFGIIIEGKVLCVKGSKDKFSNLLHYFIQCILKVDDMNVTATGRNISYFLSDVTDYFNQNDIFYTENPMFLGKSGLSHSYDFAFQRSKTKPERLCRVLNNASKTNMQNTIFSWQDTQPSRKDDSELIIIYNDKNKIDNGVLEAFQNYDIKVIPWNEIDAHKQMFYN